MARFTQTEVENILDGRLNSFRQAIGDSLYTEASPRALAAGTEYLLTNDGLLSNNVTAPDYITSRWDSTNSKFVAPEELDGPTYINSMTMTFNPTVAAAGKLTIRVYVDESGTQDFTIDPAIRTYPKEYKADPEQVSELAEWFMGSEPGYDAKNNGVYFTIEAESAGNLYETFFSIYRT